MFDQLFADLEVLFAELFVNILSVLAEFFSSLNLLDFL